MKKNSPLGSESRSFKFFCFSCAGTAGPPGRARNPRWELGMGMIPDARQIGDGDWGFRALPPGPGTVLLEASTEVCGPAAWWAT